MRQHLCSLISDPSCAQYKLSYRTTAERVSIQAEEVLEPFARDFRQFWDVVSNNEATVEMVDACLRGAYSLGITQPHFRPWLPLSKIGETVAILHIMRCNLCLERGDLARAVHDAQAAVALSTVPGTPQCAPKATSSMWFAQACRALGRACVVRRASMHLCCHVPRCLSIALLMLIRTERCSGACSTAALMCTMLRAASRCGAFCKVAAP